MRDKSFDIRDTFLTEAEKNRRVYLMIMMNIYIEKVYKTSRS